MYLRRFAIVTLALLAVLSGFSFSCRAAKAEREWTPGNMYWNLSNDGTLTIGALNPAAWNNYMNDFDEESPAPWLIDEAGNDHHDQIKKVVLKKGVRNCGEHAFNCCKNLTTVEMDADSVEIIGPGAFRECKKLETVRFSGNLEEIMEWAFEGCSSLSSVTFPASLEKIESAAFASCNLSSVKVAEGAEVKTWAFYYPADTADRLFEINLPENVQEVGSGVFAYNLLSYTLPEVVIPSGTTTIGSEAFEGSGVRFVWLPEDTTRIGSRAFANCDGLKYVYVPSDCQDIGEMAFDYRTAIVTPYVSGVFETLRNEGYKVLEVEDPYGGNG